MIYLRGLGANSTVITGFISVVLGSTTQDGAEAVSHGYSYAGFRAQGVVPEHFYDPRL